MSATDNDDWRIDLLRLLSKAKHMRNAYKRISHDRPPYSVDDYLELIGTETGYTIDLKVVDWESDGQIRGMCLRFEITITIRVPKYIDDVSEHGATRCEQRFITLKEAAHLVIDEEDAYVDNCLALVDAIVFESQYASIDKIQKDGRSDLLYGKLFAMELLFPPQYRDGVIEEISNGLSTYEAAQRFMIPEKELIWVLSDDIHPGLSILRKIEEKFEREFLKGWHPEAE